MGSLYDELNDNLREFIARQKIFFVATAPLAADQHVNLSPKGLDCLRILGPKQIAYLDLNGSGIETVAHLRENGRLTLMFCAFEGAPKILRLYGQGEAIEPADANWSRYERHFCNFDHPRSIILLNIQRIADSCGYGVPLFDYRGDRDQLLAWTSRKGSDELAAYRTKKNRQSIDGLPGLKSCAPEPSKGAG